MCQEKLKLDPKMWPLVKMIMQEKTLHLEKKFVTVVLRHVVSEVESGDASDQLLEIVEILSSLAQVSCSDKQTQLWTRAAGEKRDSDTCIRDDSALMTQVRTLVLTTLQSVSKGGLDTRLMRECFIPLLHHIAVNLKTRRDTVTSLCNTFTSCQEKVENKVFLKEFQKMMNSVWPEFYRSVLKNALNMETGGCVEALKLLTDICQFLNYGDKLSDGETLYQMIISHSHYLRIMSAPPSDIKTAVVQLLLALVPHSCDFDQVNINISIPIKS